MNPLSLITGLSPLKWYAMGAVALAVAGVIGVQHVEIANLHVAVAECVAGRASEKASAAETARQTEAAYRAEDQRRAAAQQVINDEADRKLTVARADAAIADAAAGRLSQRVAALVAAARSAARDPQAAASSSPTDDPIGVLADVLGRADARAGLLGKIADERGVAGSACEQAYDALTSNP